LADFERIELLLILVFVKLVRSIKINQKVHTILAFMSEKVQIYYYLRLNLPDSHRSRLAV